MAHYTLDAMKSNIGLKLSKCSVAKSRVSDNFCIPMNLM